MSVAKHARMSVEAFLAWEALQEEKWELVDGLPLLRRTRLMAGGTVNHSLIATNILAALRPRLRGGPCVPMGADIKSASPTGAVRYPDVTVDCGKGTGKELLTRDPRAIFEVLSPSNTPFVATQLLSDYQAIDSLAHIVFLSQDTAFAQSWSRADEGWKMAELRGLDAMIELKDLSVALPMREIYEDVVLDSDEGAPPVA